MKIKEEYYSKYKFDFSNAFSLNVEDRITKAIEFIKEYSNIIPDSGASESEISNLESDIGISFPADYIIFLKKYKFFKFYDGLEIFGIPTVKNGNFKVKKPYKFGKRFIFSGEPYIKYLKFFVYLDDINGAIYRSGPKLYAPSFSLAFWRMCKERKEKVESEIRQAKEIIELIEGIIEFNITEFIEFENLPATVKVIDYEDVHTRNHIIEKESIVISDTQIKIEFDYPLNEKVNIEFENEKGFTRIDLYRCIYEGYKTIYNGPYEIWGHFLAELYLEGLWYNKKEKTLHLHIGS